MTTTLLPFSRTTLRSAVVDHLRVAIDEGQLVSGDHLAEVDLSKRLGVSRATLREALRELQQEGLLVQDARGRVLVRTIDEQQIRDLFEVRLGLESIAVSRLCRLADRSSAVTRLRERLQPLASPTSVASGIAADVAFHELLCREAGNEMLHHSWLNLTGLIRMTMVSSGTDPARTNMSFERHSPIVDLIEAGDPLAAHAFLAAHMASAVQHLLDARADGSKGS